MDLGLIWGRFSVLGGSWGGLGGLLGGLGVAMGAQDRIVIDFGSILRSVLGPQTDHIRSNIDAEMHSNLASVFGSIFYRILIDIWVRLAIVFGPCWTSSGGLATQQNNLKTHAVFY